MWNTWNVADKELFFTWTDEMNIKLSSVDSDVFVRWCILMTYDITVLLGLSEPAYTSRIIWSFIINNRKFGLFKSPNSEKTQQ